VEEPSTKMWYWIRSSSPLEIEQETTTQSSFISQAGVLIIFALAGM
jgi:hypothetical protein